MNDKWYTPEEIATALKINKLTVYKYIKSGRLKAIKIGRHYRIAKKDFDIFVIKNLTKKSLRDVLPARDYDAVKEAKRRLIAKYKDKILLIKVFGSKARGEAHKESDLDLFIVVKDLTYPLEKEIRRTVYSVNDDFDYEPLIVNVVISDEDYNYLKKLQDPFLQIVQKEGINVWKAA